MKPYTVSIDINKPRDETIALFRSAEHMPCWQTGLVSVEHKTGNPGEEGSTSLLVFKNFELTETIDKVDLPDELHGTYAWSGGMNTLVNRIVEIDSNTTRWESTCSYQFSKLGLKLMGMLLPGMFRKQNQAYLKNFKAFCEHGWDVRKQGPA